jgi:DNA-binding HxlR family transcriptional regulator
MSGTRYAQFCALARAAEILGERWTLLIIRELLLGPKRFADLEARLDGVSPTVLTSRLNALVENGLVRRGTLPPPFRAQVYELTPVGEALRPAFREVIRWGGHFLFPMREDDAFEPDWGMLALDSILRRTPTPRHRIGLRLRHKDKEAGFVVTGGPEGATIEAGEAAGVPVIACGFDVLLKIIATELPLEQAVEEGLASVEGSMRTARALPRLFDLAELRASRGAVKKGPS